MSSVNAIKVVKESIKLILTETDLTTKKIGDKLKTPLRVVPCTRNLLSQIEWYPAGESENAKGYISIFVVVTAPTVVKSTFSIDGSSIQKSFTCEIKDNIRGYPKFVSHEELCPFFRDGKLTITCAIEFYVVVPWSFYTSTLFQSSDQLPTDFTLIIGDQRLESHKQLLSLVSPVLNAMFSHDNTVEAKSGTVVITDFDPSIVKTALDFLYGREMLNPSIEEIIGVLRFADKYNITFLAFLEHVALCNISFDTFATILHYAFDCSKEVLLGLCDTFFKDHQHNIKHAKGLNNVPHKVIIDVIENAFRLTNSVDVLRQAHKSGFDVVKETLAHTVAESLCVDNFSDVASCAWDCSSDFLKEKCAQYLNQHWADLTQSVDFVKMNAETIKGVMEAAVEARDNNEKMTEA